MHAFLNRSLTIGSLQLPNRLIQGPLAGFSCAPFRKLFYQFSPPAYCVTEMISAHDVLHKHHLNSRYLYRATNEKILCYQIAGNDPTIMAEAARRLADLGADLIDINCGCPKPKIRKKGAGSSLLENQQQLIAVVKAVRMAITIPLTVKVRIQRNHLDQDAAQALEQVGVDALIVHGRHWTEDYDKPCDLGQIAGIKEAVTIPVIANGDIADYATLTNTLTATNCDGYMIARAGTGRPWLYQTLLDDKEITIDHDQLKVIFLAHLQDLAALEGDHKALLQSKSLFRYYFKNRFNEMQLQAFYTLEKLSEIEHALKKFGLLSLDFFRNSLQ